MTQEEKQLLLADFCARLPYHCRVFYEYVDDLDNKTYGYSLTLNTWCIDEFNTDKAVVKPYLRPMSSMTEEEIKELLNIDTKRGIFSSRHLTWHLDGEVVDYLNSHHFDYRGLIEKGLALQAPEGMYNIEEK